MLLTIEKSHLSRSLEKMSVVPGEMVTFHIQTAPDAEWKSYSMSGKFLDKMLTKFQNMTEAERAVGDVVHFKAVNGHSFEGVDDETGSH